MNLEILSETPSSISHKTPILFVHGAWHGAWCWKENFLPHFAKNGYHAYALSLRGHGNSPTDKKLNRLRIADYVADIEKEINKMSQKPILVGHSMGGLVVQKYLETHPVSAAILMASLPPQGILRTSLAIFRRHPIAFLTATFSFDLYKLIETPELAKEAFFSNRMPDEKVKEFLANMNNESFLAFLDMLFFNLPNPNKNQVKMLVLGAENDSFLTHNEISQTGLAYNADVNIFSDMAHDMMLEKGWQLVADYILNWLSEQNL